MQMLAQSQKHKKERNNWQQSNGLSPEIEKQIWITLLGEGEWMKLWCFSLIASQFYTYSAASLKI